MLRAAHAPTRPAPTARRLLGARARLLAAASPAGPPPPARPFAFLPPARLLPRRFWADPEARGRVELSTTICSSETVSLLLLEGDLLVGLVGVPVISSWKIGKGPGLLLRGACEVVVELAISGAEEKLTIRKGPLSFVGVVRRIGTCISTNHVEEIKELEAQVLSSKKDLEKRHEGKSALDKILSVQQSPNDKSGLGFNSNNKNKSKSKSNKKKGQDKVKDPAKLVCFKCKVEGHHVRSCPLKKKKKHLSEK
ncbi:hypothetical protein QYE76_026420 [Lolium multiflorum]|uniref:CCHC-type domain-containing protein n=1 Tax=Lolium multiflorum TaxID=4521 RepID=A0AAD8RFX3_LOLMU|nr:hypothetical protein QYE76_026420 [Lolium multiflorum]